MFWWIVLIGVTALVGAIVIAENRRGSKGESAKDDRHLNGRDPRGGGGEWSV